MDITDALAPNSDQLDAIELVTPRTFTIAAGGRLAMREGKTVAEIPFEGFPRVWRPSKGMLDVLAKCWGTDAKQWVGRRVTLYRDPDVMFGKDQTGGTRISHMSHIDGAQSVPIRAAGRGRAAKTWRVEPLGDAPAAPEHPSIAPHLDAIDTAATMDALKATWMAIDAAGLGKHPELWAAKEARKKELE
ncbi:hypothetical protein ACIP5T_03225 [Microbacterium sp. NPDC088619]|uniref:hypothetical protein n=1 Tax=Microbacterium sp. NPDC088619 TaxID=3364196 RepID=UPI003823C390